MPVFAKEVSKIKMVILTKHGHENETWWSPIAQNRWNNDRIITGMMKRFARHSLCEITNALQFYQNGVLIYKTKVC